MKAMRLYALHGVNNTDMQLTLIRNVLSSELQIALIADADDG